MATCELCGTDASLVRTVIEGTPLDVCGNCASFGKTVERRERVYTAPKRPVALPHELTETEAVVQNFAQLVKDSREKKGLTQTELAGQLNEKASLIHKIETGVEPSIVFARKLEKFLHLTLVNKVQEQFIPKSDLKNGPVTIGDMVKIKNTRGTL